MKISVSVDTTNLQKKFQKNVGSFLSQMILDAAHYFAKKMRDEILSGQIVGVRTGDLRQGTRVEVVNKQAIIISEADYTEAVLNWSKQKYGGQSYFELAYQLYGGNLHKIIKEEAAKFYRNNYVYYNPL